MPELQPGDAAAWAAPAAAIADSTRSSWLNRAWRIVATAFCFACFGAGGLVMRLLVFPLVVLLVRNKTRRARIARATIHHSFRLFAGLMCWVGVCSLEVRGRERLARQGLLVLANHPSLIDVVFLISLIDNADCIVKGALVKNPFTRGPVLAAGYVCNDDGPGLVQDAIASVRAGSNLVIFPEGTRTPRDVALGKLQRGAANLAVRGALNITPVRIHCHPLMLGKGEKWYRVPARAGRFVIEVGEDIPVCTLQAEDATFGLAARQLTDQLTHYFSAENPDARP